jgi:5-methylcytosine-specific restriction endonuclease McrA
VSRAWEAGSDSRWRNFRLSILDRDRGQCTLKIPGVCKGGAEQVHHIHPLSKGGAKYDPANCAAACAACNQHLGDREPADQPAPRPTSRWDEG